jgi:hypothetical protein
MEMKRGGTPENKGLSPIETAGGGWQHNISGQLRDKFRSCGLAEKKRGRTLLRPPNEN